MTDGRIPAEADVVTKLSTQPAHDTAARLTAMITLAASHHFTADLAARLSGINALTDALVAS
jgi:hypothetical protein